MRDSLLMMGSVVVAFLIIGVFMLGVFHLANPKDYGPAEVPKFSQGQIVKMKAFGHRGMVIDSHCPRPSNFGKYVCRYSVRFSAVQTNTNTRVFGSDGLIDVSPVSLVSGIMEYELEASE